MKALKLKYGEYYSLRITDSSKNIINNVEFAASQIIVQQQVISDPTYNEDNKKDNAEHINELVKGIPNLMTDKKWDEFKQSDDWKALTKDEQFEQEAQ